MAAFEAWLTQLRLAGKGGAKLRGATRGRKYRLELRLDGDFTGAVLRSQIRASPDAAPVLAQFAVTGPTVVTVGPVTTSSFVAVLAAGSGANSTGILPADSGGDGYIELPVDFLLTPSGGDEELLFGAVLPLIGRITL
jgi:hypothetical protein